MKDRDIFRERMGRAVNAGYRYLGSVEKAIRRLSDRSTLEARRALRDAGYDAGMSVAMLEDILLTEANLEECMSLCDSYQGLLMDAIQAAPDKGPVMGNLLESADRAGLSLELLRAAVDGYRPLEEKDGTA